MRLLPLSMRWWLGFAFAAVAATTAIAVAVGMSRQSENAFRVEAESRAIDHTVAANAALRLAITRGNLDEAVEAVSTRRRLALFVLDKDGEPITAPRAAQTELASIPGVDRAIAAALDGRRYVRSYDRGAVTVVALPMPWDSAAALVTYSLQPGYGGTMAMIEDQVVPVLIWAVLLGGLGGVAIAFLTTRRLRRIASAAHEIEGGSFGRPLEPRFLDEIGSLAATIDRMRVRLQESFDRIQSERLQLRRTLERLDQGVITVDADLMIEAANDAAGTLFGAGPLVEGAPLPDPWADFPLRAFAQGLFQPDATVTRDRFVPDEGRCYTICGIPAGAAFRTALLVVTDVTEIERREATERDFVTNAAHELRTPVAAIRAAFEVLAAGAKEKPEERDHFLAIIERQSERLVRLSRALLVLARAQSNQESVRTVPVDLCPLLDEIAAGIRHNGRLQVDVDCPPGLEVLAEPDLVDQVFSNLAANAAKHTDGGRVGIRVRAYEAGRVEIELADTGSGMPDGIQRRVFERFYRGGARDSDGFGLGLAIVRQAVDVMNGTVEVSSVVGGGTTFRVTLPLAKAIA
ncbi:MAG: ATP-binding protein [Actinomycetota bacterium]|nr:ATP-binding protein [Actinomycetota bacterium]